MDTKQVLKWQHPLWDFIGSELDDIAFVGGFYASFRDANSTITLQECFMHIRDGR